jgi:hypothetical protein
VPTKPTKKYVFDGDAEFHGAIQARGGVNDPKAAAKTRALEARLSRNEAASARAQASASVLDAQTALAGVRLELSTTNVSVSRAGTYFPAAITARAKAIDGASYYGRFIIATSEDASTWTDRYTSAADESLHAYTFTTGVYVRVRLYEKGGIGNLLREAIITVTEDVSATPLYWGPRTTPPASNFKEDDYYFDSNVPASGGGVIRYYDGYSWEEMTSAHPLYHTAMGNIDMLADMCEWATNQATVIAAATAIVQKLVASDALIKNLYALKVKIQPGGSLRGGDRYDKDGAIIDPDEPGFYLGADGVLEAKDVNLSGYIEADSGNFLASINTPIIQALLASNVAPWTAPSPSWLGSVLIAAMASIIDRGIVRATGVFGGKTVVAIEVHSTSGFVWFSDHTGFVFMAATTYTIQGTIDPSADGEVRINGPLLPFLDAVPLSIGASDNRFNNIYASYLDVVNGVYAAGDIVTTHNVHATESIYSFGMHDDTVGNTWKTVCSLPATTPNAIGFLGYWDSYLGSAVRLTFAVMFGVLKILTYDGDIADYVDYIRVNSNNLQFRNYGSSGHVASISGIKMPG